MGEQKHIVGFTETKNGLGHGIESGRLGAPLFAEVSKSGGVVREKRDQLAVEKMEKTADGIQNG